MGMNFNQLFFSSFFSLLLTTAAQAQFKYANRYLEVGLAGGASVYSGELTKSFLDFKHMHLAGGVFARYHFNRFVGLRLQATYGNLSGDDKDSKEQLNQVRNLHFKSHIFDVALTGDFFLLGYNPEKQRMFSPYVSAGLAVFNFNPKARNFDPNFQNDWIELQPLNTEGQGAIQGREAYRRTQFALPLAVGVLYAVHSHINIGLEVGYRATFTDYIDDVGLYYATDAVTGQSVYEQTPYRDGFFDNKSQQELMSDRTYEYFVQRQGENLGTNVLTNQTSLDEYQRLQTQRGGIFRGAKGFDRYLFAMLTVSYNFIDNGLVGARSRRKKRNGCPGAQF
jgi:opacity protein-like surface antigen